MGFENTSKPQLNNLQGVGWHSKLAGARICLLMPKQRTCSRPEIEHVQRFAAYAKFHLNETRYYPPVNQHRYLVALALYSKCITVAEATLVILRAGFIEEAFGMTRTMFDIFFTLHYIANQESDERALRFAQFAAKDREVWTEIAEHFWPEHAQPLDERTKKIAKTFSSPHSWTGKPTKSLTTEPDNFEVDPKSGRPIVVYDFHYRVAYRWTSHYVHPTIAALRSHLVQAGRDNFVVRGGSFLVRSKTDLKTVQNLLRHSQANTTLQLYSHSVSEDRLAAQGSILEAILQRPAEAFSNAG